MGGSENTPEDGWLTEFRIIGFKDGWWGLVESEDGVRGWWRSLCSNQVTNCS
jgi:hypothetical protein